MSEEALGVTHLSKKFCKSLRRSMWYGIRDVVTQMRGSHLPERKLRKGEFWALYDVSFNVSQGEMLGIVGPNGSGKTTLLKLLNGILLPDEGSIRVKGRVGALITIGAGFHPLLTGRENIYINAALLKLSKEEIEERFDEIVEFADIGDFLDMPVKNYSSGMFVRLGFAIAVCCEVDILLVDEVLSVGDLSFQNKCLRKLAMMRSNSQTIVFVSHNLEHIRSLCDRIVVMDEGKVIYTGNSYEGLLRYHELMRGKRIAKSTPDGSFPFIFHQTSGDIIFGNAGLLDLKGNPTKQFVIGEPIITFFEFEVPSSITCLHFTVGIRNDRGQNCIVHVSNDQDKNFIFEDITGGKYRLTVKFNTPMLVPGVYYPVIAIRNARTQETYERIRDVMPFTVVGNILPRGIVYTKSEWKLDRIE